MNSINFIEDAGFVEKKSKYLHAKYFGIDVWPLYKIQYAFQYISKKQSVGGVAKIKSCAKKLLNYTVLSDISNSLFISSEQYIIKIDGSYIDRVLHECISEQLSSSSGVIYITVPTAHNETHRLFARLIGVKWRALFKLASVIIAAVTIPLYYQRTFLLAELVLKSKFSKFNKFKIFLKIYVMPSYVLLLSWYIRRKLLKHKVSKCYVANYYSLISMSYVYSCASLGIETYNVQHGTQTSAHPAFAPMLNIPSNGYNTLPSNFICWDNENSTPIKNWSCNAHQTIVKGHPLRSIFSDLKLKCSPSLMMASFNVLVTLHPRIGTQPKILNDLFLSLADKDIKFSVRLHPRQDESFHDILPSYTFFEDRVTLFRSTDVSLYDQIALSNLHITGFSSSFLEASYMDVQTLFIDAQATEYYPDYVREYPNSLCLTLGSLTTQIYLAQDRYTKEVMYGEL